MRLRLIVPAVLLGSITLSVHAADLQGNIETARSLMQTQKKAIITEAMKLDPKSSDVFWPLYNEYAEALRKVGDKKVNIIKDYAANYEKMTDEKASALINESLDVEKDILKVKGDYIKKFSKVLPGRIVARFFQADNKIQAYVNAGIAEEIPLIPMEEMKKLDANAPAAAPAAK